MVWYVDSSVILRALKEQSQAAREWFNRTSLTEDRLITSKLGEVEVERIAKKNRLDQTKVDFYLNRFAYISVSDEICAEAIALKPNLSCADAIHVATALRLKPFGVTLVTHDAEMAAAAIELKLPVIDPVTDDPNRPPMA